MSHHDSNDEAVRGILADSFTRVRELVQHVTEGLSDSASTYRLDAEANTIAWLVWHAARVQDDHVADLARTEQVWTAGGWYDRFALPLPADATGYGHDSDDVAAVVVGSDLLDAYQAAVHESCLRYVDGITSAELSRVVDDSWDPPVTASARLVSVLGDCLQHLGQAAYVRGIVERA